MELYKRKGREVMRDGHRKCIEKGGGGGRKKLTIWKVSSCIWDTCVSYAIATMAVRVLVNHVSQA